MGRVIGIIRVLGHDFIERFHDPLADNLLHQRVVIQFQELLRRAAGGLSHGGQLVFID